MATTNYIQDALLHKKIDGVEVPVYYQTLVECVKILEDGGEITLAAKLEAIITSLNSKASSTDLSTAVTQAIADLVGGAPEELDTLKELADLASSNKSLMEALNDAITSKVDAVEGKTLISESLLSILSTISNEKMEAWSKGEANKLEGITVNGASVDIDENKVANISTTKMTMGTAFPTDMKDGDFHILIHSTTSEGNADTESSESDE